MNIIELMKTKPLAVILVSTVTLVGVIAVAVFAFSGGGDLPEKEDLPPVEANEVIEGREPVFTPEPEIIPEPVINSEPPVIPEPAEAPEDIAVPVNNANTEPVIIPVLNDTAGQPATPETLVITDTPVPAPSIKAQDIIQFGGYNWQVLEVRDGKALIITNELIENRAYHNDWVDVTWENSSMRAYLNGEFFNSFTAANRAKIADTQVVNSSNPWYETSGGNNTTDKIFLLSIDEVLKYFGDSGQLASRPKENNWFISDEYNADRITRHIDDDYNSEDSGNWWWLRSPGENNINAAFVFDDGILYIDGYYCYSRFLSVRPAMWITL
ncbi:MAG: DUF6273 domain-containing protein [Oscillospiraceae bacterium]|nr:DUF6273 domain-containing protein [Oscillospiraceae bacterium]